jgi:hypothetical protein
MIQWYKVGYLELLSTLHYLKICGIKITGRNDHFQHAYEPLTQHLIYKFFQTLSMHSAKISFKNSEKIPNTKWWNLG